MAALSAYPLFRPLGLTAAILGITQGLVWTIGSMLWIILYYGAWKPEDNFTTYARNLSTTIYQQYFNKENEDNNGGVMTAARLSIFSWMFLVLSFFWFLNSSHLCWALYREKPRFLRPSLFLSSIITGVISLIDFILVLFLSYDYDEYNVNQDGVFVILACGIMMSLAARGYILWIINVIFIAVQVKFAVDLKTKGSNKRNDTAPINGFASNKFPSPGEPIQTDPWISNPRPSSVINEAFDFMSERPGFIRSQSFTFPEGSPPQRSFDSTPRNQPPAMEKEYKVATIGRKIKSPQNAAKRPVIPPPDYTPPGSPNSYPKGPLKSVLKNRSQYA